MGISTGLRDGEEQRWTASVNNLETMMWKK